MTSIVRPKLEYIEGAVAFERPQNAAKTVLAVPHEEIKRRMGSPFGSLKASNSADVSGSGLISSTPHPNKFQSIEVAIKSSGTFVI